MKVQEDGREKDPRGLGGLGARAEGGCERSQGRDLLVSDTETDPGMSKASLGPSMSSSGMCGRPRPGLGSPTD